MSDAQKLLAEILAAEIDEHGYEDDDEKRWQVAYHWAAEIDKALGGLKPWTATENDGPTRSAWVSGWTVTE